VVPPTEEKVLRFLATAGLAPDDFVMESGSISLLKKFVRQDYGIGFVERGGIDEELESGTLERVRILEGSPVIEFGIGYRNRKDLSHPARAFLRLLDASENLRAAERPP